jgi:iron complex transport system substrate-binding protein
MPRLTRRVALAAVALGLAAALSACAGATASTDAADAATRTVSTPEGKVKVPASPKRIVSIHSWTTESLLDLGVTPIGVEDSGEQYVPQRYLARWKPIDKVAEGAEVDLEKIAALKPDLIVGVDVPYLKKLYPKLKQIAPTAFAAFDDDSTWHDYPAATAAFVDREKQLATLKSDYEAHLADVKSTYADQLATLKWDVIQGGFDPGNYWIYGSGSAVGEVLTALGAQYASASAAVTGGESKSVSYEQASLLGDADAIVYYTNNDGSPANSIDKLFALDSWKRLPAVTTGMAIGTPDFLPGSYSDADGMLGDIEAALKARAKG